MNTRTTDADLPTGEHMARALRDSEARLRSVINSAPLVLWTLDREGTFTSSEGKGLAILGLRPGEVVGRSVFEVYREYPQLLEEVERALAGEEFTTEVAVGGAVFETRYSALRDEQGELAGTIGVAVDVTERRHAEEALSRSEERTHEILESAHDAFIAMDTDGRVRGWNSQAEATFGWPREEVLGKPLVELIIPPRYRDAHQQGLARFLATGEGPVLGRRVEISALHRDGHELPVEMTISAVRQGESYLFSAFLHEITVRKQAEGALQRRAEQAQRFQDALLELARADDPDLEAALRRITRVDADALEVERVSVWFFAAGGSELRCRVLFTRPDGAYSGGTALRAAELPDYFQALRDRRVVAAHDAVADLATHEFADEYLRPLGITSMLDVPVWRRGTMIGVVCHEHVGPRREWTIEEQDFAASIADMVSLALEGWERAQAERAARETEARKASIVEASVDCIVTMDAGGRILEFNPAAERVFGYRATEVIGRDVAELIVPERLREPHRRGIRRYLATGESSYLNRRIETTGMRADESEFPAELTVMRIPSPGEPLFTGVIRDITERKQAEEALRTAQREAQTMAERMRAVATAAAGVIGATSRPALREVLEQACRQVLSFDAFFMMAYDARSHSFLGFGGTDAGVYSDPTLVPAAGTPGERIVRERRTLVTRSADDPAARGAQLTGTGRRSESAIRTPILSGPEVLGILVVQSYTPGLYSGGDVEVLEAVASLAATALENIRLLEEQQAAEETLREREEQLAEAQALAHLGSWQWEVRTNRISWSDELYRIYGVEPRAYAPTLESYLERVHPEDHALVKARIQEVLRADGPGEYEHRIVRADGAVRALYGRAEVLRAADGQPERMWGTAQDITEMKEAEAALRSSEQRAQAMAERMRAVAAAAAGVIGAESLEALQEVLQSACRKVISFDAFTFALYDPQAHTLSLLPGYDAGIFVPGETISARGVPMERVLRERRSLVTLRSDDPNAEGSIPMGTGRRSESIIRTPIVSGERVLGTISVQSYTPDLYTAEDVQVLEAVASLAANAIENIRLESERRAAEEALRVSETRFRTIFEQFPLSLQIFSPDGRTLEVNRSWQELFHMTPEQVGDFNPLHDPQLAEISDYIRRGFAGETLLVPPSLFDTGRIGNGNGAPPGQEPDDPRWIQAFICPVKEDEGEVREVFMIHQDVTAQKEAEEVLRRSHEEMERLVAARTAELAETNRVLEAEVAERQRAEEGLRQRTSELEAVFQALPDLYFRLDADGRILDYRTGQNSGLFLPPEQFLGRRMQEILPQPAGRTLEEALHRLSATGELECVEYSLPFPDGNRDFEARLLPHIEGQIVTVVRDITEQKEAERALQRSEEHFRRITENSSDVASILDARGVGIYHSPSAERVLGYPVEEILGTSAFERIDPADHQKCREALGGMFRNPGTDRTVEFRYLNGKKGWRVLEVIGRTLLPHSAEAGVIINARDVTERKEAEDALRRSEERFRALIENGSDLITVVDAEGVIQYQSPSVTRVLGYDAATLLGRDAREFAHPDDVPDMVDMLEAAVNAPGTIRTVEFRFRHAGGSWRVFESIGRTLLADSASEGVVITSRDITDRKEAERALQEREEHFRRLIENAYDMVLVMDTAGTITYASPSAQRVLGSAPEELTGRSGFSLVHPDDVDTALARTTETVATPGAVVSAELRLRHRDGSYRILETFCRTVADDSAASGIVVNARDATERKHSEEQLRLQKTLLEAQGEASIDGILVVSPEGKMLSFNRRFVEMWGIPEEVVESKSDEAAVQAVLDQLEDPEEFIARIAYLYEHRDEESREEISLRDGRIFDRYSAPVRSREGGDYYGRIWFFRDITERKHAEQALRASEESYRGLFDTLTELVYVQDLEGRFVNVNDAVVRAYGYSREEIIGQGPDLLADPQRVDVADTMARFHKAVEGEPQRFEWWGRRKDGSVFPKELVLTRSTYFGQDVVIAVARDVTERKQGEQALRESEQRFRAVVENASDLVTLMDGTGVIRYQSPAIERTYGYTQEELVGRNCFELVHPDDAPQVIPKLAEVAAHPGETRSAGFRFRHKDGRWIHVEAVGATLSPTSGDEGVVVNTRDITERKETMEALERAKQEAEEANRAKSEFLSRMSHELRTPMNSILGFAQLLQRKPLPSEEHKRVEHILKAGRHLLNLINEVLDIARIEAGRQNFSVEPVQVATVVQEALGLIRPLAAEWGCRIEECCPFPELYVRADRQRLTQVLLNLLSNAVKYNHRGGSVCVRWEMQEGAEGESARLRLGVQDTGPGIAPEKQAKLFVPFERLGAEQSGVEGTGLGLALSKRLVEAMGGALTVESVVGEGSTFWIEFAREPSPLERLEVNGGLRPGASEGAVAAPAATILYVEDNLANLALIESILESRPEITLVTALQGQMGLELAAQHQPDLILLDLHLPDLRGDEVFKRLQSEPRTRGIPVVIITADAMPARVRQLMEEGVRAYLTKPLDVDEFLDTIDGVLAEREER